MPTRQYMTNNWGRPSYGIAIVGLATAASATDIVTIAGATQHACWVTRVVIGGLATSAATMPVQLIRRITATTGGTSTVVTPVQHNLSQTPHASVLAFTANPSVGTATFPGGVIEVRNVQIGTATAPQRETVIDLTANGMDPVSLPSPNDVLAINLGGVTYAGSSLNITIHFME